MVNRTLTGLLNRGAILRRLDEQIEYARRYETALSLSLMDIDYFKHINDRYGHLTGDDILERIGTTIKQKIRGSDAVGRYGGEEFIIILPRSNLYSALNVAERIRKAIELTELKDSQGNAFGITVSQGVSSYRPDEDVNSLISRADHALYQAKENGRNRTETSY